jgi:aldehyde dehydrogenase (NAD+)
VLLVGGEDRPARLRLFRQAYHLYERHQQHDHPQEKDIRPVLCIITYRTDDDAITIANDTIYGLQAYVMSPGIDRARAVASRMLAGRVLINGWRMSC